MGNLHIYTAAHQLAMRFDIGGPSGFKSIVRRSPRSRVWTSCCGRQRWAANCTVQVYYDGVAFHCAEGKGCRMGCVKCDEWRSRAFDGLGYPAKHAKEVRWHEAGIRQWYCRSCRRYRWPKRSAGSLKV